MEVGLSGASQTTSSVGGEGDYQLQLLEDRVNQHYALKDAMGGNGEQALQRLDPRQVLDLMAQISMQQTQQPLAGMSQSHLV
ncbi:MAG: hypothetical protein PHH60_00490 [Candidatus Margulisbacteria bacterium]|nr:hypothetical protein [Candidatus Margulisiibacteriota bacterium]